MKKLLFALLTIFIIVLIILVGGKNISLKQPKALIQNHSFKLLLAKTEKDRETGLSLKKSLPQDIGMLFMFDKKDYYSFWMKNMKFPIDIIFIRNNKIVTVYSKVKPPINNKELAIYQPNEPVDTVLEINSGLSEKYGFRKDMSVQYENIRN
jgi:uncharacterized protein